jgi:hypothetical protein
MSSWDPSYETLSLTPYLLLQKFNLPQKVRVTRGFYDKKEEDSLGEGDEMYDRSNRDACVY